MVRWSTSSLVRCLRGCILGFTLVACVVGPVGCTADSGVAATGSDGEPGQTPSFGTGSPGEQDGSNGNGAGPVFASDTGSSSGGADALGPGPTGTLPCSTDVDCDAWRPYCLGGKCVECIDDSHCTGEADRCSTSTNICLECLVDGDCASDEMCTNGGCQSKQCTPGETSCNGANLLTCRPDGVGWDPSPCASGLCEDGACVECTPLCADDLVCWQGECLMCKPFSLRCNGNIVEECTETGKWQQKYNCAEQGIVCFDPGYCASACGGDPKFNNSNSGCEYWAVDLDNHYAAQDSPYAVIVSNLSDTPSMVTISKQDGSGLPEETVIELEVLPGELRIFDLPSRQPEGAKLGWFGYHIQATNQIIAYQFNPLDNVDVFSNDASLLLPVNTYGKTYRVFSMPQLQGGGPTINPGENCSLACGQYSGGSCLDDGAGGQACTIPYRGTMTVLAAQSSTVVTITPTTLTLAGDGLPVMQPGQTYTYQLEPFQVLNIKTDSDGGDLTGTLVTADKPVAVFGGHEASVTSERCCADHLEQQMFPTSTWGTTYIATKAYPRGVEKDYWRIMAAEDNTTVSFTLTNQASQTLQAGQWIQVVSDQDFVITGDKPIGVAQVLPSAREALVLQFGDFCTDTSQCHPEYTCTAVGEAGGFGESCFSSNDCAVGYQCDLGLVLDDGTSPCLPSQCNTQGSEGECGGVPGQSCACIDVVVNGNVDGCWCMPTICMAPACEVNGSNVGCPTGHTCACFAADNCYCAPVGDPALILHAPAEQYRSEYVFLTPDKYVEDYVNIVAPAAATVTMDDVAISEGYFTPIGDSGYKVGRIKLGDGVHRVDSDQPIGVVAYGFDRDVSYGYMAGLNLQKLSAD
ncbi:MAG: IgGFc-binding protein [Myxococcota bacterium]